MIGPVRLMKFGNKGFFKKMPVCIESSAIKGHVFLLLSLIFFVVNFFHYADLEAGSNQLKKAVAFIVFFSLMLFFSFARTIKRGSFVMAADEKGIYYRVLGEKGVFLFLEWRFIIEISEYSSGDNDYIVVKAMVNNYNLPRLCNAITNQIAATKYISISISTPQSLKSSEIKLRLDGLRVKSQNAILA